MRYLNALSAHANREELLDWIRNLDDTPERIFLVHGEPHALDSLRSRIEHKIKVPVNIPQEQDQFFF